MNGKLSSAVVVIAGLLGSSSAVAQDGPRHIVEATLAGMVVAPMAIALLDPMPKPTDVVRMTAFVLLPASEKRGGKQVDVISLEAAYDCAQPNRWRSLGWVGYQAGKNSAVVSGQAEGGWAMGQPKTTEAALWARACHPSPTSFVPLKEDLTTQAGREKALLDYRSIIPLLSEGFPR